MAAEGANYFAPPAGAILTITDESLTLPERTAAPAFENPVPVDLEKIWTR